MTRASYRPHVRCRNCNHETRRLLRSPELLAPCPKCGSRNVELGRSLAERLPADGKVRIRIDIRGSTFRALRAAGVPVGRVVRQYLERSIARGEI